MGSPYSFWPRTAHLLCGSRFHLFLDNPECVYLLCRVIPSFVKGVSAWEICPLLTLLLWRCCIWHCRYSRPSQITGSSCRPFRNFARSVFWRVICPGPGSRSSSRQPPCFYPLSSAGSMNAGAGRRSTVLRALPLSSRWSCSPQAVSARNIFTLWPRGVIDGVDRLCAFLLLCVPLARAFSASSTIPLLSCSLVDEGWYQRLVTYMFLP